MKHWNQGDLFYGYLHIAAFPIYLHSRNKSAQLNTIIMHRSLNLAKHLLYQTHWTNRWGCGVLSNQGYQICMTWGLGPNGVSIMENKVAKKSGITHILYGSILTTRAAFTDIDHLIPIWISNHMPSKECDEIIYPCSNLSGCTVEGWEVFLYHILYNGCNYLSILELKLIHASKRGSCGP